MRRQSAFLCLLAALSATAVAAPPPAPEQAEGGIWKAVVPIAGTMHGEFANLDPIGLSAGVKVPADCSINWVDPDTGKLYCFSSGTSLEYFLESPHAFLASARGAWRRLEGGASR